jgi:two-component system LytT family response regulator
MTMKHFKPHLPKTEQVAQNLFILTARGRVTVQPEDIIYLEANINYTTFYTIQRQFTTSFHLKFFGEALQEHPDFLRINKSYIINLNYLENLDWHKNTKQASLANGAKLPISRRKAKALKEILWSKLNN